MECELLIELESIDRKDADKFVSSVCGKLPIKTQTELHVIPVKILDIVSIVYNNYE